MKYRPEWIGRLVVNKFDKVLWDGKEVGRIRRLPKAGAKSPGGMKTNMVFVSVPLQGEEQEHNSFTKAIEALIPR